MLDFFVKMISQKEKNMLFKYKGYINQRISQPDKLQYDVIAAPINAQVTDAHSIKQLRNPCFPSLM